MALNDHNLWKAVKYVALFNVLICISDDNWYGAVGILILLLLASPIYNALNYCLGSISEIFRNR